MNNDQVSILHLKQRIIQEERRVPSTDTFQIGLTYGKISQAFGTMTGDTQKGNILAARSAWEQLTGDPLAPERVYALAGLLADIVGVEDVIAAVSTGGAKSPTHTAGSVSLTDTEFWDLLTGLTRWSGQLAFSPAAAWYFFCFWFHIFAFGENVEPKESPFHAAAGEKDVVLERPRKSCY